jgi:hypothetical protein
MPHRAWKAMFHGFMAKHWQNNGIANTDRYTIIGPVFQNDPEFEIFVL